MMEQFKKARELTANEEGAVRLTQGFVMLIVILVVTFGDVMFIKIMWSYFPDGFLRICAIGGAVATAMSIIALLVGKRHWFRPGEQLYAAYFFTGIEVAVSILNVLIASGVDVPYWRMASPATPFVALVGWIIIWQLDTTTKQKHEDMEMEDKLAAARREYTKQEHAAALLIQQKALEYNTHYMLAALENPEHQQEIAEGAEQLTRNVIHNLTGRYVPPRTRTIPGKATQPESSSPLVFPPLDAQASQSRNGNGSH